MSNCSPNSLPSAARPAFGRSLALVVLITATSLTATGSATAQSIGTGSAPAPDGNRPQTTQATLPELLESGGTWIANRLRETTSLGQSGGPTRWDSTESPQATVLTFADAMQQVAMGRDDEFTRALQTFPGGDTPSNRSAARELLDVFDRLPQLSPSALPAAAVVRKQQMSRWELFPRGIANQWAYSALDQGPQGVIRLERVEPNRWLFTKDTVRNAAALADSMRSLPPRPWVETGGGLFEQTVVPTFTQSPWWAWLVAAAALVGGLALARACGRLLGQAADALASRGDELIAPLLRGLTLPVGAFVLAAAVLFGTASLHWQPSLEEYRWNIAKFLVLVGGLWLLVTLLEVVVFAVRRLFVRDDDPYAKMTTAAFRRLLRVAVIALLVFYVFQNVLRWNVTALVGGIGLLGLALSLAARDAVSNLFGAVMIFLSRPFLVGDWIVFKDELGQVVDVSLQMTKVRLLGGEELAIPNQQFVDASVENLSKRPYKRRVMEVAITYDTPSEKVQLAMDLLREVLSSDAVVGQGQGDLDRYPPHVSFTAFGPHYLNLRADYWYLMAPADSADVQRNTDRGYLSYLAHRGEVNLRVLKAFEEAGIDFAFPTQTIKLDSASDDEPGPGAAVRQSEGEREPVTNGQPVAS